MAGLVSQGRPATGEGENQLRHLDGGREADIATLARIQGGLLNPRPPVKPPAEGIHEHLPAMRGGVR